MTRRMKTKNECSIKFDVVEMPNKLDVYIIATLRGKESLLLDLLYKLRNRPDMLKTLEPYIKKHHLPKGKEIVFDLQIVKEGIYEDDEDLQD